MNLDIGFKALRPWLGYTATRYATTPVLGSGRLGDEVADIPVFTSARDTQLLLSATGMPLPEVIGQGSGDEVPMLEGDILQIVKQFASTLYEVSTDPGIATDPQMADRVARLGVLKAEAAESVAGYVHHRLEHVDRVLGHRHSAQVMDKSVIPAIMSVCHQIESQELDARAAPSTQI